MFRNTRLLLSRMIEYRVLEQYLKFICLSADSPLSHCFKPLRNHTLSYVLLQYFFNELGRFAIDRVNVTE